MLALTLLMACADVRSIEGSIECVAEPGQEFVFTASVTMRERESLPTAVIVDAKREESGALVVTRSMDAVDGVWRATASMDELGTGCGSYLDDGMCYTFTATGQDRRTVEDVLGPEPCHENRTPVSGHSGGGNGGGNGGGSDPDDCYGTLVCNDGTMSCSCNACTSGCCSGHGGCQ